MGFKLGGNLPNFAKATIEINALAKAVVAKSAADAEAKQKQYVPVKTGNLKNSISTTVSDSGLTAEIGPTANYGVYVENGTSRQAPQPFVGPSTDEVEPAFLAALEIVAAKALGD